MFHVPGAARPARRDSRKLESVLEVMAGSHSRQSLSKTRRIKVSRQGHEALEGCEKGARPGSRGLAFIPSWRSFSARAVPAGRYCIQAAGARSRFL
jgi:hypothetical protein